MAAPDVVSRQIADCTVNLNTGAYTFVLDCGHRVPAPYTAPPAHIPMVAPCPDCTADTRRAAVKQRQKGRKMDA